MTPQGKRRIVIIVRIIIGADQLLAGVADPFPGGDLLLFSNLCHKIQSIPLSLPGDDRCVLLSIRRLSGAFLWHRPDVWNIDSPDSSHVLPLLSQRIWMALCQPGPGSLPVPADCSLFAHLPDAHLPWTAVCDSDLPSLYVDHELCKPLRHFKVAHPKRSLTRLGRGLKKNLSV